MDERYVAFDVETPNAQNRRMSAIGVCVIEQGQIVQELDTLVDPETHFDPFNVALTGITPEMERGQPTFAALWQLLEPMLRGSILVAHNAPFAPARAGQLPARLPHRLAAGGGVSVHLPDGKARLPLPAEPQAEYPLRPPAALARPS